MTAKTEKAPKNSAGRINAMPVAGIPVNREVKHNTPKLAVPLEKLQLLPEFLREHRVLQTYRCLHRVGPDALQEPSGVNIKCHNFVSKILKVFPGTGHVRFSNRPFGVKHLQTIHHHSVDVAHGLVLLFGIGTRALPSWDSRTGRNNLCRGLAVS